MSGLIPTGRRHVGFPGQGIRIPDPRTVGAVAAGIAAVYAGKRREFSHSGSEAMGRTKPAPKKKMRSKGKVSTQWKADGAFSGKKVYPKKKRRSRKSKSLKDRVKALEKNKLPVSSMWKQSHQFFKMGVESINTSKIFEILAIQEGEISTACNFYSLDVADRTAKIKNCRFEFTMRNAMTANQVMRYQIFKCTQNCQESVLTDLREYCIDRGHTFANTITAATAQTATASALPARLQLDPNEVNLPFFNGAYACQGWKPVSKLMTLTLGPGDETVISYNTGQFLYRPDDVANSDAGDVYFKNYDYHLIVQLTGAIGHDQTNVNNIALFPAAADTRLDSYIRLEVSNGLGQNQWEITQADDTTGVTTVVQADNQASAVEPADT